MVTLSSNSAQVRFLYLALQAFYAANAIISAYQETSNRSKAANYRVFLTLAASITFIQIILTTFMAMAERKEFEMLAAVADSSAESSARSSYASAEEEERALLGDTKELSDETVRASQPEEPRVLCSWSALGYTIQTHKDAHVNKKPASRKSNIIALLRTIQIVSMTFAFFTQWLSAGWMRAAWLRQAPMTIVILNAALFNPYIQSFAGIKA